MRNLAPNTQPERQQVNHASSEAWIAGLVKSGSWRATRRSLPLLWLVLVSAFVFPMGWWSTPGAVSQADEIKTDNSNTVAINEAANHAAPTNESNEPDPIAALPELPSPNLVSTSDALRVKVIVSGRIFDAQVPRGTTVKSAIEACNLPLGDLDRVYPARESVVHNDQKIRITRVRTVTKARTVEVNPDVRYQLTNELRPGKSQVVQWGQSGVVELAERIWFKDGKVSAREPLARKTVRETQDKVIALGARSHYMPGKVPYHNRYERAYRLASRAGSPRDRIESRQTKTLRAVRSVMLTATGYSPDPSENGGWTTTATGLPIGYGAAAVDPRVIPLGTKMYVEGYGYAFACDTGGAIKGHRIDLAYDSYGVANSKGRRKMRVWILAP